MNSASISVSWPKNASIFFWSSTHLPTEDSAPVFVADTDGDLFGVLVNRKV
ncbi:hypothetical protein [Bythopirellula polymerisocia]|uniref:Uncharacterized protein n=1 Tax=Bythopirellula polymerisocia TaxID=2528003 RepID=A0A5C6CD48_9BACT|nr:hypothetical protein [Bythopirellula polymerisocia]TWU20739.1 hypothetical protein Pla144_49060 [Bythopirellula polymerisocia]